MDDTLEALDESRRVAATTLALVLAQIGVLALAVLTMLVGLVLLARRPELGLARLRGQSVRRLVGAVSVEWLAVVVAGSAVGVLFGYAAARVAATRLPTEPALVTTAWVAPALLVTIVVSVALMAVRSRQVASEPVPTLLRSTQPRSAGGGPGAVALDAILVTAAVCGAVVGLQSPADSALVIGAIIYKFRREPGGNRES